MLSVLLLRGLSVASSLARTFGLMDRDRQLPMLRSLLLACVGIALSCVALVLALAILGGPPPAEDGSDGEAALAASGGPSTSLQESMTLDSVTEPPVGGPPAEEAGEAPQPVSETAQEEVPGEDADTEPQSVAVPPPEPAAPRSPRSDDWRPARIAASGEVTLRSWPNGAKILFLQPGERVLTREELREAGGHTWEQVRLPDGRTGWVVERFVNPD